MDSILKQAAWLVLALIGATALGTVALSRGESINALWIVVAAVAIYLNVSLHVTSCNSILREPRPLSD